MPSGVFEPAAGDAGGAGGGFYYLPRQVYACRTDGGIVFLDARRDRYVGLGGASGARLGDLVVNLTDRGGTRQDLCDPAIAVEQLERLADTLIQRGLLCRGTGEGLCRRGPSLAPPQIDGAQADTESRRSPRLADVVNFVIACLRASWSLRWLSLGSIASRVTAARRENEPFDFVGALRLAQVFQTLRCWFFSEKNRCLFNALSLVYFLQRYGHFPYFVIGVKTTPFAAHSWVQRDRIVLDGDPASVGHFTPILVA
jgi:Transglutaminase-like superfamily